MVSALARAKELQKEREERKANGNGGTWVNHFLELRADDPTARVRFLYNLENPDHKDEMIALRMHDYFVQADNRFVRAICAEEQGLPCHWCQVFEQEKAAAEAMPARTDAEKKARSKALGNAYRKEAKDHFIVPCVCYELDESGRPKVGENRKFVTERKLLDLKQTVLNQLITNYEQGIEVDDEGTRENDIRVCDFVYSRSGTGTDTKYTISPQRARKFNLVPPSREEVMAMIEECRPPRVVERSDAMNNASPANDFGVEDDEYAATF